MIKICLIVFIVGSIVLEISADPWPRSDCDDCENPCDDCDGPRIHNKYWTEVEKQRISDQTVLVCTPDSHFSTVVYDGKGYDQNTTCFGIEKNTYYHWDDLIYAGLNCKNGKREELYGKPYTVTITSNNGNVQRLEQATLTDCECEGDTLVALADYVAGPDPLTGCCSDQTLDVNSLTAVAYKIQIFGKCCSTCYLQKAQILYPKAVNNNGIQ